MGWGSPEAWARMGVGCGFSDVYCGWRCGWLVVSKPGRLSSAVVDAPLRGVLSV
ncbi:hypothetical protein ODS41_05010 [Pyrobaculum sp. 3827-6]|uniref:hypothetical protein n=1 Tax=Pyrobaculum sp. 3827-6 TaxID=2983604 RepID=UPI0021D9E19E|nr:hypothetical protein [Pyrobaculum sp. 3827-6]MCU7787282.1 hypothetical protein [Pyrobaculum sp. 3827-6]